MLTKFYKDSPDKGTERVETGFEKIRSLVDAMHPGCPEDSEGWEYRDCQSWCENFETCETWKSLKSMVMEEYVCCYCNSADGLSDEKTGHRQNCKLGERGRKIRRQLEDRLRKDVVLMLTIARIVGINID